MYVCVNSNPKDVKSCPNFQIRKPYQKNLEAHGSLVANSDDQCKVVAFTDTTAFFYPDIQMDVLINDSKKSDVKSCTPLYTLRTALIMITLFLCGLFVGHFVWVTIVDDPPICPMPKPTTMTGCGGGPDGIYSGTKKIGFLTAKVLLNVTKTQTRKGNVDISIDITLVPSLVCKMVPWTYDADKGELVLSKNTCYSNTIGDKITNAEFKYDYEKDVIHLQAKVNSLGKVVTFVLPGQKKCTADA